MEKFISIPVTDLGDVLIASTGIAGIAQASTTTVVITYKTGLIATITHATAGAGVETARDAIVNAVVSSLKTAWTEPNFDVVLALPFAVSAVAYTLLVQAAS